MEMKVGQKNSVCILSSRERGVRGLASHRILQQLVEEKTQRMKWQSQVTDTLISVIFLLVASCMRKCLLGTMCNVRSNKLPADLTVVSLSQLQRNYFQYY